MDFHSVGIYCFSCPASIPTSSGTDTIIYIHLKKNILSLLPVLITWVGLTPFGAPGWAVTQFLVQVCLMI